MDLAIVVEGEREFRTLVEWGEPLLNMVQPMPYVALQQLLDPGFPWSILDYSKVDYLHDLPDDAIETMVARSAGARSPFSAVILCSIGGAVARMDRDAIALQVPATRWMSFCEAVSWDAGEQEREIAWARDFMSAMRPWSVGAPSNFLEPDEGTARLSRSFGEEKYHRLVALKGAYDPENVFSLNGNIRPNTPATR